VYEKERASRIEGRETDQHNRHCQPTRSSRFYVWIWIPLDWIDPSPHPGQGQPGQIIHIIPLRPLIVSAHTAPSVIPTLSGQLHSPPVTAHCSHSRCCVPFPCPRLFIGLPAIPPPSTVAHHTPAFAPCPNRVSCLTSDAARHKALVLVYIIVFRIFCSFCIDEYIKQMHYYLPVLSPVLISFHFSRSSPLHACGQRAIPPRVAPALAAPGISRRVIYFHPRRVGTCIHTRQRRCNRLLLSASPSSTTTTTMEKHSHILPTISTKTSPPRKFRRNFLVILTVLVGFQLYFLSSGFPTLFHRTEQLPFHAERSLARCASLRVSAGPPTDLHDRTESDRFEHGTKGTLLHNARIWTGENNGTEVIHGDVFLDKGIIQGVGNLNLSALRFHVNGMMARGELNVVDVHGAWVTPGCVSIALGPLQPSSN
jgi:hypothetical protein